jgi:hypothetical protein
LIEAEFERIAQDFESGIGSKLAQKRLGGIRILNLKRIFAPDEPGIGLIFLGDDKEIQTQEDKIKISFPGRLPKEHPSST